MAVESFQASSLRTKIMGGQGFPGPGSAAALNRLPQPLHGEFDILRLQVAPALDLGLVAVLREALEVFRRELLGGDALSGELLADVRVLRHPAIKASRAVLDNASRSILLPICSIG